ncbi:MAG: CdaR family protein [Nitrospirota bacterium]
MKKSFLENLNLKIVAVLLSFVLWIFVTSRGQIETSLELPIEFKDVPAGVEVVNCNAKTISVNVKGQERLIHNLKSSDVKVRIDAGKTKSGENIYYITRRDIKLPHGLIVTNISPSQVRIVTEETVTKKVKVVPALVGEADKDYYVKSVIALPDTVEIEGIKSAIRKVKFVKTEPLDITGVNETFTQNVKLDIPGKNVRAKIIDVNVKIVVEGRRA